MFKEVVKNDIDLEMQGKADFITKHSSPGLGFSENPQSSRVYKRCTSWRNNKDETGVHIPQGTSNSLFKFIQ
jgi:hypothetical protein